MRKLPGLLLLCVLVLNPRCLANATDTPLEMTASPTTQVRSTPESPTGEIQVTSSVLTPANPAMQGLIQKARKDLADRLSVPLSQINLLVAEAVNWSDSSLGCPEEGVAYAQVLTSGYRIVLESKNVQYEYHAGKGSDVIYCPNPQPPVPIDPGNT